MQNKRLWMMIVVLSAVVTCCGLWVMFKPQPAAKPAAESLQGFLMEHVKYLPEVYHAH